MSDSNNFLKRRLVISDVHGCSSTLKALVEKIGLTKHDHLYFLGDYIDRGPDSAGVLDYILKLTGDGHNIFPLRGNHEGNILQALKDYDRETFIHYVVKISKSPGLLDESKELKKNYKEFFESLQYYFELNDYILVHAGINFSIPDPFADRVSMLELRRTEPDQAFLKGRRIIHGHQVHPLDEIIEAVSEKRTVIPLDSGCYYTKPHKIYDHTQTGHLCCLNLDTFELITQKNIEEQKS